MDAERGWGTAKALLEGTAGDQWTPYAKWHVEAVGRQLQETPHKVLGLHTLYCKVMSDVKSLKFNPSVTCSGLTLPQILSRQKLMQRARTQWSRFQVKRSSVHCGDESGNIAYNRSCSRTGIIPLQSFHNKEEGPYSLKVEIGYCNL